MSLIEKFKNLIKLKNYKCKVCNSKLNVEFYEVCEEGTDIVLLKGNFCPKCIMYIAIKARNATFKFEDCNIKV